jgi:hypothetical protein
MISIESVLPIFEAIDGADLSPRTFSAVCATSGWGEPVNDGIGLWEVTNPANGAMLIFDTVTKPTTLFCRLDAHDDYEPDALQEAALRRTFDERFVHSLEQLRRRFPQSLAPGDLRLAVQLAVRPLSRAEFSHRVGADLLRSDHGRSAAAAASIRAASLGNYRGVVNICTSRGE